MVNCKTERNALRIRLFVLMRILQKHSGYQKKAAPETGQELHPVKNLLHPTVVYVILDIRKGKPIHAALSLITTVYTL